MNRTIIEQTLREAVLRCLPASATPALDRANAIYRSPGASAIKDEMIQVGRKLWERQYVDGNGGNISYRIAEEYVLCTPTMCSKGDLKLDDLSLINMENARVCGDRPHTSEVLLHLEIYKAVPQARAVIHCHPPHATAYAITGLVPPANVIPEQEVFVGPLVVTPYETPGTKKFAETILPYARKHNTILLGNHGIVCWADTLTHAEWLVEIVDTYCRTIMLAMSLGGPIKSMTPDKVADLLELKRKLGLPDNRLPEPQGTPAEPYFVAPEFCPVEESASDGEGPVSREEIEDLVARMTDQVLKLASKAK